MAIKDDVFNSIVAMRPNSTSGRRLARLRGVDSQVTSNNQNPSLLTVNSPEEESKNNRTQTEHKLNTNTAQTEHIFTTKENTKVTQTAHNLNTNDIQKNTKLTQTSHEPYTKSNTKPDTNEAKIEHKFDTKKIIFHKISMLTGLQKDILFLIYNECQNSRSKITEPLTVEYISSALNIRVGSIKTTIKRLMDKCFLNRVEFKNGRGGWAKYELPDNTYREILQLETEQKLYINRTQSLHKLNTQNNTKHDTSTYSSSILNLNKKTNTTGLPDEWKDIDCEPISHIGFSRTQLLQLYEKNLNLPEVVQESIYHFAFGLENNSKIKEYAEPLNVFMGVLRKGGAWIESNYESPQKRAMRELLDRKEKERQEMEALENRLKDVEFRNWLGTVAEEVMNEIVPKQFMNMKEAREGCLKKYFEDNIWAIKKQSLL
ncbi:MAG: hypothetical protein LEGION0398_MBIBDBAK_00188 [Legionellaceae bacterium]